MGICASPSNGRSKEIQPQIHVRNYTSTLKYNRSEINFCLLKSASQKDMQSADRSLVYITAPAVSSMDQRFTRRDNEGAPPRATPGRNDAAVDALLWVEAKEIRR
jgi:hypothetical protein